jgi:hypothetical protein
MFLNRFPTCVQILISSSYARSHIFFPFQSVIIIILTRYLEAKCSPYQGTWFSPYQGTWFSPEIDHFHRFWNEMLLKMRQRKKMISRNFIILHCEEQPIEQYKRKGPVKSAVTLWGVQFGIPAWDRQSRLNFLQFSYSAPAHTLKLNGNYISHLLQQITTLHFVFMCFVRFSL